MTTVEITGTEVAILPPDVQTRVAELQPLDGAGQAAAVTALLSHSRTGLLAAIAAHDLPQIAEWKQKASAIQEITKQVRLGKDMQLDAAEFVRRAERGLGVAIREGQERGEIRSQGVGGGWNARKSSSASLVEEDQAKSPYDFARHTDLYGDGKEGGNGLYAMTDGVSDEAFEEAITEAKAEGNLSRANVARKSKAKADPHGSDIVTPIPIRRKTGPQRQKARAEARNTWISSAIALQSISTQLSRTPIGDLEFHEHDTELLQAIDIVADAVKAIGKLQKEVRHEHGIKGA